MPYGAIWMGNIVKWQAMPKAANFARQARSISLIAQIFHAFCRSISPEIREKQEVHRAPVEANSNYAKRLCSCVMGLLLVIGIMAW